MREVFSHVERYSFVCLNCGDEWDDDYELREWHVVDEDYLAYTRDGQPSAAPTARDCRSCGNYTVRVLPEHSSRPREVPAVPPAATAGGRSAPRSR